MHSLLKKLFIASTAFFFAISPVFAQSSAKPRVQFVHEVGKDQVYLLIDNSRMEFPNAFFSGANMDRLYVRPVSSSLLKGWKSIKIVQTVSGGAYMISNGKKVEGALQSDAFVFTKDQLAAINQVMMKNQRGIRLNK